jgi:alpha-L-rhamnosidase
VLRPAGLRCELLLDPLTLDTTAPTFSWRLETGAGERGILQSGYRILVDSDGANLWDSGRVASRESLHVRYAGPPLEPGQLCRWRVRSWDGAGNPSLWSNDAVFGIGPIGPGWSTARELGPAPAPDVLFASVAVPVPQWIGLGLEEAVREEESGPCPLLRREFELAGQPTRATIYASALGLYELRLNGRRVGDRCLTPEWTSYRKRVQYQAYDVAALLRPGLNAIAAQLAPGWYAGRIGMTHLAPGGARRGIYGRHLRLILRLDAEIDAGRTTIISDGHWRVTADGALRTADLLDGETVDLRREPVGWDEAGFDDSGWDPAFATEAGPRLVAQSSEPIRVTEELAPVIVSEPTPGSRVFDLGQEIAGWCRLRARGPAGAEIVLRHAEMLDQEGRLYRGNLRTAALEDRFILRGDGVETLEPRFTYRGFRYVEVSAAESARIEDVVGCAVHSDVARAGRFECSNELVNRIVRAVEWTLRDNLHSVPTDCPQRDERMGWTGDFLVFAHTAAFTMQMGAFFRKWLRDLRDDQADDGRFGDFAPHPFDPNRHFSGNPAWADAGLFVPWCAYLHYADLDLLEEHFESARRWVDFVHRHNPDLLWRRERGRPLSYGDWLNGDTLRLDAWPASGGNVPFDLFSTAFFARSTDILSRIATVLDRTDDAAHYEALAARIREGFAREFVAVDGRVAGDTQAGYALALEFDLVPDELRERASCNMLRALERYDGHLATGFITTVPLMLQLARFGHLEQAYALLLETTIPSWGYMIENGATTIWERWDGYVEGRGFQDPRMNSFCHYAIGAVGEWIWRVVAGLEPDEAYPGWERFVIHPRPGGGLTWARAEHESLRGMIRVAWELHDHLFTLRATVPPGTCATVRLPALGAVDEGGLPVAEAAGVTIVSSKPTATVLEVGSGDYEFSVRS